MGKNNHENENTDNSSSPKISNGTQSRLSFDSPQNEDSNGSMESNQDENRLENILEIENLHVS